MDDQAASEDYSDDQPANPYGEGLAAFYTEAPSPYRPRTPDWESWHCGYADAAHRCEMDSQ
jgi:hypothetical protein